MWVISTLEFDLTCTQSCRSYSPPVSFVPIHNPSHQRTIFVGEHGVPWAWGPCRRRRHALIERLCPGPWSLYAAAPCEKLKHESVEKEGFNACMKLKHSASARGCQPGTGHSG